MAKQEMDQLAADAYAAKKTGVSYGQYMAQKLRQDTKVRELAQKKHERGPVCACCGKPIPKIGRHRKYCGAECADKTRRAQKRAATRAARGLE